MKPSNLLERLQSVSVIVADTGEIEKIKAFRPCDATTNPSLILAAVQKEEYRELFEEALGRGKESEETDPEAMLDRVAVRFGREILRYVPGVVSTEVDARCSFDVEQTLRRARRIIDLYEREGVSKDRVLIKIAATWEGIRSAEILEKEGVRCNMTLIFSLTQAAACAEAGAFLVSPFVGRILDWYRQKEGREYPPEEDPGVLSVKNVYRYYKRFDYPTVVMAASFRNAGEILELAGCDRLTVSPALLEELANDDITPFVRKLSPEKDPSFPPEKLPTDEASFRWAMNENAMASEKLAEGIRKFASDTRRLERIVQQAVDSR